MQSFMCFFLAVVLFYSPLVHATEHNRYILYADQYLARERAFAESQAALKFNSIMAIKMAFVSQLGQSAEDSAGKMNESIKRLQDILKKYYASDYTINEENFRNLLLDQVSAQSQSRFVRSHLQNTKAYLNSMLKESFIDVDFCSKLSQTVDVSNLKSYPMNHKVLDILNYTHYATVFSKGDGDGLRSWTFSADPVVDGAAVLVVEIGVAGAVIYSLVEGSALSALISSKAITLAVMGPAAGIALLSLATIAVVSSIWTSKRNKQRRAEVETKNKNELLLFHEAQDVYKKQRLSNEQYQKLALDVCSAPGFQATLQSDKQKLLEAQRDAQQKLEELQILTLQIEQYETSFGEIRANFTEIMRKNFTAAHVKTIEDEVLPIATSRVMWQMYNEQMKTSYTRVLSSLPNLDCMAKKEALDELKNQLHMNLTFISYMSDSATTKLEYESIKSTVEAALRLTENRLADCPKSGPFMAAPLAL